MMIGIVREPGAGKTAVMTFMALKYFSQGFRLYSNYQIVDPETKMNLSIVIESKHDLERMRNGFFLGDELWDWMDSRMSMDDINLFLSGLLLKLRKRHANLIYTTHSANQIDKRLRENTDYWVVPIIHIRMGGKDVEFKQSILEPIPISIFLDYIWIEAFVVSAATERVIERFEFKLKPISDFYNTAEEVHKLGITKDGNNLEVEFGEVLCESFREGGIAIQSDDSGTNQEPPTLDWELQLDSKLYVFDVTKLKTKKSKKNTHYYLELKNKNHEQFLRILNERSAETYFAYKMNNDGDWMIVPTEIVWTIAAGKQIVPLHKILNYSRPLPDLITGKK